MPTTFNERWPERIGPDSPAEMRYGKLALEMARQTVLYEDGKADWNEYLAVSADYNQARKELNQLTEQGTMK